MLAELAAANAAFAVIKTAVQNGKDIASAGNAIANFVGAKEDLQRKATKKGNSSDLEEFMALEQIREQEEQLKRNKNPIYYAIADYFNPRGEEINKNTKGSQNNNPNFTGGGENDRTATLMQQHRYKKI